jgi:hypothetical protein
MKQNTEQMSANTPSSDSPRSEIKEVIQSLQDIARKIEKLQDSPPAPLRQAQGR